MIVTGRDFRANQSRYIGIAHSGEDVILKSRAGSVRLIPVDTSKKNAGRRDLAVELRSALSDVKESMQGKKKLLSWEELLDELDD
ncbi:MAG: prevent-host-death family protein [Prevotella sp.]|nr:prevent-host-death family protein [Prevotella sp.]